MYVNMHISDRGLHVKALFCKNKYKKVQTLFKVYIKSLSNRFCITFTSSTNKNCKITHVFRSLNLNGSRKHIWFY